MLGSERPKVLLIGIDAQIQSLLFPLLKGVEVLLEAGISDPAIILVSATNLSTPLELVQELKAKHHAPIFFCFTFQNGFEPTSFIKAGFTATFLLPIEMDSLQSAFRKAIATQAPHFVEPYHCVKLLDLDPGETLDFDTSIFLPGNNRYVKICNSGEALDAKRLEKIKKSKINNLYVPNSQIHYFYQHSAKKLRKMGNDHGMSATERKEKMAAAVRELLSDLFSEKITTDQSGQEALKTCGGIVSAYILEGAESEWFIRIQQVIGEYGDHYSHPSNVSTLAALFSMGTGIGKPEDLALAGLLHDIGKSQLPDDLQELEAEDMNPVQLDLYKKHPEMSVALIKQKKISAAEAVIKIVLQHHEFFNGTGFPNGAFGDQVCKESQILSLADRFDHLTKVKPGLPLISPAEAVQSLKNEQVEDPSKIKYKPEILKELLSLFPT